MTRGRKPKVDAIRRQAQVKTSPTTFVERRALPVPAEVAADPIMSECWENLTSGTSQYTSADTPLLHAYCFAWTACRQAMSNMAMYEGQLEIDVMTEGGRKQSPDMKTFRETVNTMRQLSSDLNANPLARIRAGLMEVATHSMAADIPAKVAAAQKALGDAGRGKK